jgi:hypothetical protein
LASTVFVNGVTLSSAAWFQDVDNVAYQYLTSVAGTNTITAIGPAGLGAYAAGLKFRFIPAVTNTGATTINITGTAALGARNIFYNGAACLGGELRALIPVEITDDGTQFNITSLTASQGLWTPSVGGTATYSVQVGTYTRIGRLFFVSGSIQIGNIGTGSTTTVSGLPATSITSVGMSAISLSELSTSATNVVWVSGRVTSNATTFQLLSMIAAGAALAPNAIFGNGTLVTFSGCYQGA